eukprot:g6812.t1 g6812   contig23:1261325-1261753(+)
MRPIYNVQSVGSGHRSGAYKNQNGAHSGAVNGEGSGGAGHHHHHSRKPVDPEEHYNDTQNSNDDNDQYYQRQPRRRQQQQQQPQNSQQHPAYQDSHQDEHHVMYAPEGMKQDEEAELNHNYDEQEKLHHEELGYPLGEGQGT